MATSRRPETNPQSEPVARGGSDGDRRATPADPLQIGIETVRGIGPKRALSLRERNVATLFDALLHLPSRYVDLRQRHDLAELRSGMDAIVEGILEDVTIRPRRFRAFASSSSARLRVSANRTIRIVWFNLPPYARFPVGEPVLVRGRVNAAANGSLEIVHPEVHALNGAPIAPIRPNYRLPPEIPQRLFASIVNEALTRLRKQPDPGAIPNELVHEANVMPVADALTWLHHPPPDADIERLEAGDTAAHQALALDELFAFELALSRERARSRRRSGARLAAGGKLSAEFIAGLPFSPTRAQLSAIDEISRDLARPSQMNRMLIGEVGSGKTLVAFWAALRAAECGYQTAVMAPTELLAEQHHRNFTRMCARLGVMSALLTGNIAGTERGRLLRAIGRGDIPIIFGTQALIQEGVEMQRLGLAVIDEQHRFGVFDRARLIGLGAETNVLLMTATPIPRSLALTLFRNLEVSVLDEMPPGRTPVETQIFQEEEIAQADALVRTEIGKGNRAYYVLPIIEDEEDERSYSVATMEKRLHSALKDARIATLYGKMRPSDKEAVMRQFRDGMLDVLVATTVVEVGIDVAEATAIVIVAADRYGLAQLHQLRGRVGRGPAPSRCCLVASRDAGRAAQDRLEIVARSATGAEIAAADLRMRGPGDLIGARQSGALPLRFAGFIRDLRLIERAAGLAEEWLRRDPQLELPESAGARAALTRMLDFGFSLGDVG